MNMSVRDYVDPKYELFIDGQWRNAENDATFPVINPSNGEQLCLCAEASARDVDDAVKAA